MKRVTIKDIAQHLCLSPSTVSRALSGDKNIRQETKDEIFNAADELGYRRNRLAVSLRSGKTNIVGVVVDQMTNPTTLHILAGAERLLHSKGVNMMVANSEGCCHREKANLHMMEGSQVDGLVVAVCDPGENCAEFLHLKKSGIPIVFLHVTPPGIIASSVAHSASSQEQEKDYHALGERGAELLLKMIANPDSPSERVMI